MSIIDILKKLSPGKTTEEVLEIASKIEAIHRQLDMHNKKIDLLKKDYKEELRKLELQILKIQDGCKHWATTYHGDPSGGSDSHAVCDICGKDFYREYRRS